VTLQGGNRSPLYLVRRWELELIDIQGCDQGDGVEPILQKGLLCALLAEIVPQFHHSSRREGCSAGTHRHRRTETQNVSNR